VHEEQHDERGLEGRDHQGDDNVEAGEVLIQVDLGGLNREKGADHERSKDADVNFGRNNVMFRHAPSSLEFFR
jgi:hypothetical protein